jgi:hypothetical protein
MVLLALGDSALEALWEEIRKLSRLRGATRVPVPKPVRDSNRCILKPGKPETAKTALYLVLAQGQLTLQAVWLDPTLG